MSTVGEIFALFPGINSTLRPKSGGTRDAAAIALQSLGFLNVLLGCFCRLFADVLNDVAMFMEILAPYFPAFFTLIMCVSGIFKVRQTSQSVYSVFFWGRIINTKSWDDTVHFYHDNLAAVPGWCCRRCDQSRPDGPSGSQRQHGRHLGQRRQSGTFISDRTADFPLHDQETSTIDLLVDVNVICQLFSPWTGDLGEPGRTAGQFSAHSLRQW